MLLETALKMQQHLQMFQNSLPKIAFAECYCTCKLHRLYLNGKTNVATKKIAINICLHHLETALLLFECITPNVYLLPEVGDFVQKKRTNSFMIR